MDQIALIPKFGFESQLSSQLTTASRLSLLLSSLFSSQVPVLQRLSNLFLCVQELHFKFGREKQLSNPLAKGGLVGPQYGNWIFFLGFPDQMSDHEQTMSCPPLPSPK
ncbi:hypothetical protein M9H77_24040 [Catharanthus roseus]|uniref:Uncharacterized protein n=1 Tax=Catharanthus roseus TaxID=4058 RepID=A0ACC0AW80_CATRO|nr:hypothetical protein M9H77_24040 [Catharanthus roseus]